MSHPFCITGMHRTGMSLVTKVLHECGVHLAEDAELESAAGVISVGYGEDQSLTKFNRDLLRALGGSWHSPPTLCEGWAEDPALDVHREAALRLTLPLQAHPIWGWNDPCNCLTLPFWKTLLPDLKLIVCLRSPLEVSRSLYRCDIPVPHTQAMLLWQIYYQQLEPFLAEAVVTHYESYFYNASAEIIRLHDLLALPDADVAQISQSVRADMRNSYSVQSKLNSDTVPAAVQVLYEKWTAQAGDVYRSLVADQAYQDPYTKDVHLQRELIFLGDHLIQLRQQLEEKEEEVRLLNKDVAALDGDLNILNKQIADIINSRLWRLLTRIYALKGWILPNGSARDRAYQMIMARLETWWRVGPSPVAQRLHSHPMERHHWALYGFRDHAYAAFCQTAEPAEEVWQQQISSEHWENPPLITLLTVLEQPIGDFLKDAVDRVISQTYTHWRWVIVTSQQDFLETLTQIDRRIDVLLVDQAGLAGWKVAFAQANSAYVMIMDQHTILAPHALYMAADLLQRIPQGDCLYSDYDILDEKGLRHNPFFKPSWSPHMLFSVNLLEGFCIFKSELLPKLGGFDESLGEAVYWDFCWRLVEHARQIEHIPHVLCHRRTVKQIPPKACDAAIMAHLQRQAYLNIQVDDGVPRWAIPAQPLISIIIPSRDKADILEVCLDSIFHLTKYPNYEVIVVDTHSVEAETHALYERCAKNPRFRLVHYPEEKFNFSRACNFGLNATTGSLILFLNNDTQVLHADWLELIAQWFLQEDMGIVGVKLLYPSGKVQHAGVIIGLSGLADHLFKGLPEHSQSPLGSDDWYRDLLAVTGACLMTTRQIFEQVGGFDEKYHLNFSDVELCLRVVRAGYRVLYTPHVRLLHHESLTHRRQIPLEDFETASRDNRGWITRGDPFFNPNLDYSSTNPRLKRSINEAGSFLHLAAMARIRSTAKRQAR